MIWLVVRNEDIYFNFSGGLCVNVSFTKSTKTTEPTNLNFYTKVDHELSPQTALFFAFKFLIQPFFCIITSLVDVESLLCSNLSSWIIYQSVNQIKLKFNSCHHHIIVCINVHFILFPKCSKSSLLNSFIRRFKKFQNHWQNLVWISFDLILDILKQLSLWYSITVINKFKRFTPSVTNYNYITLITLGKVTEHVR